MDVTTSAALLLGLKYAGPPAAGLVKEFLGKVLMPSAEASGQLLAQPLQEWHKRRVARATSLVLEAAAQLENAGSPPQPVPGRILMPLLEKGSLEEDADLQNHWAALLANAAAGTVKMLPAFVEILGQLTPIQARILEWMDSLKQDVQLDRLIWPEVSRRDIERRFHLSPQDFALLFTDMHRLQLIEGREELPRMSLDRDNVETIVNTLINLAGSRVMYDLVSLTALGIAFVAACSKVAPGRKSP
jgi:hypothetical protein